MLEDTIEELRSVAIDAEGRRRAAGELDELVRVLAYLITAPVWPASWLIPIGRRLEADDPRTVTIELLGQLA